MSRRPLTEDEVDAIVHSVTKKVVKHFHRDLAIQKFAESIANSPPESNQKIAHSAKELAMLAESYFRDRADTWHWELKRPYRQHTITAKEEFAQVSAAGLAPFQNGAR